ncbi:bifunctional folylpolyglutamate synthase/dihydrofolate synthase [Tenacibaculum ovolyticum]|uniref:bifunctional folylpolyglutamate synthase/dihydrofolate synthase n=1 Tax=Tenacibaculum ovolyticum TaxID=104270 RepID=UPI00041CB5CE|nr:folylpolyglutamate synthase/dihydrofolate synthase family protein [Tenacibaculum ovolyticum]
MTYQETLDWMFAQLPMYQRQGKTAFKKDLTNIKALSDKLGNPEKVFKTIHVGGTNGKGSTSHMIASILQEAGYKVGLYTSPHLKNFTERIRINGIEIPDENIVAFISENKEFLEKQKVSFFEMTVGMAFDYFADQKVDIAIIEVGLGGRLDSTNIITPEVSVITNIGLDHTQFLGETLPEIAYEKAGIIKQGIPIIIGEKQEVIKQVFLTKAKDCNSEILFASDEEGDYKTDLLGDYQSKNILTAVKTVKQLKGFIILEKHIEKGLLNVVKNTNLKGRWQILEYEPKIICDTAHNKEGLNYTLKQLQNEKYENLHIVLGVVSDKKLNEVLPLFPKNATYYFCKPDIVRGLSEKKLKEQASEYNLIGESFVSVSQAFGVAKLKAESQDVIYIGGSTFVVAEVL